MSKEVHRIYFCKDGAILDTQIREGEDVTDTLKRCFNKISDLETKLAESEKKNIELQTKLILKENEPAFCGLAGRDCEALGQVEELKQQLAEKDQAIENWETMYKSVVQTCHNDANEISRLREQLEKKDDEILKGDWAFMQEVYNSDQDKISFCIEQLEKVKEFVKENESWEIDGSDYSIVYVDDVLEKIDNQITQLKEMK